MISRLLVANRGEIARRVFRTCRDLGVETVAVFSDPDADMPHVREADLSVRLPGAAPSETYLRADLLVKAALDAGADAVHPGYGFLAEDAAFARAVNEAGLTWVGPPPEAVEVMGSKLRARQVAESVDVPVLGALSPDAVTEGDLPVLVKASAGGGGRGMRVVGALAELPSALEAARAEAASAFGDGTVFVEPYVECARHVEVQVLADTHGAVWALGERECSIQRRHQKVVEECPSPVVDDALRTHLCEAATRLARAVGYTNAGTVEFLLAPDGRYFFLEMNTRLQVEHPVTECVYGVDLVAWQIRTAEGEALPPRAAEASGHAVEARLYAEDPASAWAPQSGLLHGFTFPSSPPHLAAPVTAPLAGAGVRVDAGVESGSRVGVHYDPMLAKVIAWAPSRAEASRALARTLEHARIHGLATNRDLLVRILRHPDFVAGRTDTAFLDRLGPEGLAAPLADESAQRLSALAAALADAGRERAGARVLRGLPSGWRNVPSQAQRRAYEAPLGTVEVAYLLTRDGLVADGFDHVALVSSTSGAVVLEVGGVQHRFDVARYTGASGLDDGLVCVDSALGAVTLHRRERFTNPAAADPEGSLLAPMPAAVVRVDVGEGDRVAAGQGLLVLEAMKMQQPITAPQAGFVAELRVRVGSQVDAGAVLAVVEPDDRAATTDPETKG